MDAVKGILSTVSGILGPILGMLGRSFSAAEQILTRFSIPIFLAGFLGILFAFLWFLFRYLDKKKLTLPVLMFTLFFMIFLSGNMLLIAREESLRESPPQESAADTNAEAESETPGGEVAV